MKLEDMISKRFTADVAVVGGGTAGVFAAIAAARSGAKTILIEKNNILGGTMTVANVNFPGLFFAWGRKIISGPCWEAIERTIAPGGGKMPEISFKPAHHSLEQIRLNRFVYTSVLFEMCRKAGVELMTNTMLSAAIDTTAGVRLILTEKTGMVELFAKAAIDATGDANLAAISGYEVAKSEVQQPATLQNHMSGYDVNEVDFDEIEQGLKNADITPHVNAKQLRSCLERNIIDVHIPCIDADTSAGRAELEQRTFQIYMKIYKFLRNIKGLENLTVDFVAEETGVRETNRIVGESVITAEDYIKGYFYPDSVCYAFYPVDLHVMNGIEHAWHEENVVSKVPYGALIPRGARHILCAGRCISSDTYANSAVRVQAVCMATGQAAGCAAAIASQKGVPVGDVEYQALCDALMKIGAIVPKKEV